jgi:DNA-binding beta-propeller fold protein YncE
MLFCSGFIAAHKKVVYAALAVFIASGLMWTPVGIGAQDAGEQEICKDIPITRERVLEAADAKAEEQIGEQQIGEEIGEQIGDIDIAEGQQTRPTPVKAYCLEEILEDYEGRKMTYPSKVYVDSVTGEIYAVDSGNKRILIYTYDYYPLLSVGISDGIEAPVAVAVDQNGYLFVAQSPSGGDPRSRISVLNPALTWERDIYLSGFEGAGGFQPKGIAIGKNGNLYVAGDHYPGLIVLDRDGNFLRMICPMDCVDKYDERLEKASVCDVDIDSHGLIYVLSEDKGRVFVYDENEKFLLKFGQKGGGSGKLSRPRGVAVDDKNGRVYVIDYMRHTANAYGLDGEFLFEFGGKGWSEGWFLFPSDISVDTFGNVLVADTFNHRVQVLSLRSQ